MKRVLVFCENGFFASRPSKIDFRDVAKTFAVKEKEVKNFESQRVLNQNTHVTVCSSLGGKFCFVQFVWYW